MSAERTQGQAAAEWWAEQISDPVFDNGDGLSSALATLLLSKQPRPTPGQLAIFKSVLAVSIDNRLAGGSTWVVVGVDYHPDRELSAAAEAAGISDMVFPWKTTAYIRPECVEVSAGYGGQRELIWGSRPEVLA